MALSDEANNVNWLMANFVRSTPGVEQAVAVSSDGLLIAMSSQLERASADKLAAIITGMRALAHGAANELAKGQVLQVLDRDAGRVPVRERHLRWLDARCGRRHEIATWGWWASRSPCSSSGWARSSPRRWSPS